MPNIIVPHATSAISAIPASITSTPSADFLAGMTCQEEVRWQMDLCQTEMCGPQSLEADLTRDCWERHMRGELIVSDLKRIVEDDAVSFSAAAFTMSGNSIRCNGNTPLALSVTTTSTPTTLTTSTRPEATIILGRADQLKAAAMQPQHRDARDAKMVYKVQEKDEREEAKLEKRRIKTNKLCSCQVRG